MMKFNCEKDQMLVVDGAFDAVQLIRQITDTQIQEDAFFIFDPRDVVDKYKEWSQKLPRVEPYYAVKANCHVLVVKLLASLGLSFDCSAMDEIQRVLAMGVSPSKIVFANPAKFKSDIRFAAQHGVEQMTFDSKDELYKIKKLYPTAKLLLRIKSDASVVIISTGVKFGCNVEKDVHELLKLARSLDLEVVGVSFMVGSGCGEPVAYNRAIEAAKKTFDVGNQVGFNMRILDIGGGFPGYKGISVDVFADTVNSALERYFPAADTNVKIIAEPGRFFVASAFTLATAIHNRREVYNPEINGNMMMYYINDGVYGSFSSCSHVKRVVEPVPLKEKENGESMLSSIWGPTCDGVDKVRENFQFPLLQVDDWIVFENMGAYTWTAACTFNGFPITKIYAVFDPSTVSLVENKQGTFKLEDHVDVWNFNLDNLSTSVRKS